MVIVHNDAPEANMDWCLYESAPTLAQAVVNVHI